MKGNGLFKKINMLGQDFSSRGTHRPPWAAAIPRQYRMDTQSVLDSLVIFPECKSKRVRDASRTRLNPHKSKKTGMTKNTVFRRGEAHED